MVDPRWAIPGSSDVPLHIGVVREDVAVKVEGEIKLVAISIAKHLEVFAIWIDRCNVTTRGENAFGVPVGVPEARQKMVFTPGFSTSDMVDNCRRFGVVACAEVDAFFIG